MAGLTSTGFAIKTTEEILASLRARALAEIDPALDVSTDSPIGQILGICADEIASAWELAQAVNSGQSPEDASGFSLTNLAALTGTEREDATPSTVELTLTLDATTTVPAGSVVAVTGNPTVRFRTMTDVTSVGAGAYTVDAECEDTGPTAANAGTITVIVTPVSGWTAVTNAGAATPGTNVESDEALRIRRQIELRAQGTSPVDAIRADMLDTDGDWPGVAQCVVFENVSHLTVDGMPPHSIEVVVRDEPSLDDDVIAARIFALKAGGIQAYGTTVVDVEDSYGYTHAVGFTRATEATVYIEIDLAIDSDEYPADGDTQVQSAIEAIGVDYLVGKDVILARLKAAAFSVAGVVDVTAMRAGFADNPAGTANLTIGRREIAVITEVEVLTAEAVDL